MSINFNAPLNEEGSSYLRELLGQPAASDGISFLYDDTSIPLKHSEMKKLANVAGQPVTLDHHAEGEIKTMSDGTQYQVTKRGWRKVS